jgi:hypothetical protein
MNLSNISNCFMFDFAHENLSLSFTNTWILIIIFLLFAQKISKSLLWLNFPDCGMNSNLMKSSPVVAEPYKKKTLKKPIYHFQIEAYSSTILLYSVCCSSPLSNLFLTPFLLSLTPLSDGPPTTWPQVLSVFPPTPFLLECGTVCVRLLWISELAEVLGI